LLVFSSAYAIRQVVCLVVQQSLQPFVKAMFWVVTGGMVGHL